MAGGAVAAPVRISSAIDSAGARSSAGELEQINAIGQPGGVAVSSADALVNYAGFLGTFSLQAQLDTDQDGLDDELDGDNDNDGLDDLAEITGTAFYGVATDPNFADSDDDGATDSEEAAAWTDPQNDASYLHLTQVAVDGDVTIQWQASHGKTYDVYWGTNLLDGPPDVYLGSVTASNAAAIAPWYEMPATYEHVGNGVARGFYRVWLTE